jgi:hypothetical protein
MIREFLPGNIKAVSSFFAHHQHAHDSFLFHDIVQNSIISKSKFPPRDRIKAELLDASRFLHRLMAEVKLDAIKDDSLGVSLEPIEMVGSLIGDVDGERLGHVHAQKSQRYPSALCRSLIIPATPTVEALAGARRPEHSLS